MIFLFSVYLFFYSWNVIYKYKRSKNRGLLKEEFTNKYNNKLLRNIIFAFLIVMLVNILQGIGLLIDFMNSIDGEYLNLPNSLTGEWEKYIDFGIVGYLLIMLPGKIFQFVIRTIFVVCSVFIFYSKYLLKKSIMLPKYLIILLYILSILNGFYMFSELFDLIQTGGEFLWIIRNIF